MTIHLAPDFLQSPQDALDAAHKDCGMLSEAIDDVKDRAAMLAHSVAYVAAIREIDPELAIMLLRMQALDAEEAGEFVSVCFAEVAAERRYFADMLLREQKKARAVTEVEAAASGTL